MTSSHLLRLVVNADHILSVKEPLKSCRPPRVSAVSLICTLTESRSRTRTHQTSTLPSVETRAATSAASVVFACPSRATDQGEPVA